MDVDVEVSGYEVQEHCNGTSRRFAIICDSVFQQR